MKYNIEIEIDDKAIKDSGMEPDSYIRQEMGWLEDSGISLISLGAAEEQSVPSQVNLNQENYYSEYQGGVEWRIAQDPNLPVTAYVSDRDSGEPLIEIREVKDTSNLWGEYALHIGSDEPLLYERFEEAVDAANGHIRQLDEKEADRYPVHELTGNEGIYSFGFADGVEYIANAFWSEEEPGYVNYSVFAIQGGAMEVLDSGFYNNYLSTENCIRDLADELVPIENPTIRFIAHCDMELGTIHEYQQVLHEDKLDEPIHILSWSQIAERSQIMRDNPEHEALLAGIIESARNETPEPVTYKGIPLEGLDKHVSMAHSHFIGTNEGVDYLTALLARDKQALTPKQFEAMSALNSVAVMNYQVCNGGLDQYYFNQCHKEREPFSESDVKLVNKEQQVEMLRELHAFGCEVFPERTEDNEHLDRIITDFEDSSYEESGESWLTDDEEEDEGNLHAPYDFDDRYYEVNDYLETLIESYAQYLDKSIEKELTVDGRETFYFSFGTSEHFPFELGWVEVHGAKDRMEACEMYSSHYPKRDGLINCSFVYNESEWKKSGLGREELGHNCHQVITDWGPFAEKNLFDVPTKGGRTEKLRVEAGYWSESKNLTVTIYPNIKEPEYGWDYPMVEISEDLGRQPLMHAAVAERADYDIPKFLQESGLAEPTGLYQLGKNDFDEERPYPIYEFKLDKLMEIDPEMTSRYLEEHGFTVDQAREYLIASKEEKPLDELVKEAKAKAAEKNAERINQPQQDFKGIDR